MPLEKCQKDGKPGYRCGGPENPCFPYRPNNPTSRDMAKKKAIDQCLAMGHSPSEENLNEDNKRTVELKPADVDMDDHLLISSVSQPAIETDFVYFGSHMEEDEEPYKLSELDQEKRIITGPAMVPDRHIYRLDEMGGEYYVYFTRETVEELSQRLISNCNISTSIEHSMEVDNVFIVESWIVQDPGRDKANHFGFDNSNINPGTWMVSYKVNNDSFWNMVKNGEIKGLSIEGYFIEAFNQQFNRSDDEDCDCNDDPELDKIYQVLKDNLTGTQ